MDQATGQPDQYPTARKLSPPEYPHQSRVLEYRGTPQVTREEGQPWFLMFAALGVYVGSTAVALLALYLLVAVSLTAEFAGLPTVCVAVALFGGIGMLILEYQVLAHRNARSAITIGIVLGAVVLLLLMFAAYASSDGSLFIIATALAGVISFGAIAHFVWALRRPAWSRRRWRV